MTNNYDQPRLAENPEPRCPVVLVLDVSGSMSGQPIQELNQGLQALKQDLSRDAQTSLRAEVAIVTFGGTIALAHDFATVDYFSPPTLTTTGNTPMGAALDYALTLVSDRKEQYKNNGIKYYQPWIWLITDGAPTDSWQAAAQKLQEAHKNKKISFFAVAVKGADMQTLKQIAPSERPPLWLNGLNFTEMFKWISQSLQAVSQSRVGEESQIKLAPTGWGTL